MNGEWPAAVARTVRDMVDSHQLMDGFQGAALLGSLVSDVVAMPAPVHVDWPRVGITGEQVWLQVWEVSTYVTAPYEVLQHMLAWVDEYGRRWDRGGAG